MSSPAAFPAAFPPIFPVFAIAAWFGATAVCCPAGDPLQPDAAGPDAPAADAGDGPPDAAAIVAANASVRTSCAEEDNVNVPLSLARPLASFTVVATHPATADGALPPSGCAPDFAHCPPVVSPVHPFPPEVRALHDDGETVVEAVREASWWRARGMSVRVDGGPIFPDAHYIRVSRHIPGTTAPAEYPQFFVFYMDGNMRLIPFPPLGRTSVCFGSSVIVGPAAVGPRPVAEIDAVEYLAGAKQLAVTYSAGGSAILSLDEVSRTEARVQVTTRFPSSTLPFATFRSMYVADGNADVDHVQWVSAGAGQSAPILSFSGGASPSWFFYRARPSVHNPSAPDVRVSIP